jgi:hypothetical protein
MPGSSRKVSGLLLAACLAATAQTVPNWKISRNGAQNPFYVLIPDGTGFLGVGSAGLIAGTRDGAAWAAYPSGTEADLHVLIKGDGLFVAAGDSGVLLTSPNGVDWNKRTAAYAHPLVSGAFGNGAYVLLGNDKTVLTSADGVSWSAQSIPSASGLNGCAFGEGRFLIVGDAGSIFDSPDGKVWTSRPKADFSFSTLVRGDSVFVARDATYSYHSKDGLSWTKGGGLNGLYPLSYAEKRFLSPGPDGTMYSSSNGETWSRDTTGTRDQLYCLSASAGKLLASGVKTTFSPDGKKWETRTFEKTGNLKSVAYGNGRYVAVGSSGPVQLSADGSLWSTCVGNITSLFTKIIFANGKFTALGELKSVVTSVDGDNWVLAQDQVPPYTFTDVASGASGYVMIGNMFNTFSSRSIAYGSQNGNVWDTLAIDMLTVHALVYGSGKFVAVGHSGAILSSDDGVKWDSHAVPGFTKPLFAVASGGGVFVAVGDKGGMVSSPDGVSWTNRTTDTTTFFTSVTYNGHQFVAIGSGSAMRFSTDGATWTNGISGIDGGHDIYYGGGRHIMLGSSRGVAVSTDSILWVGIRNAKAARRGAPWKARYAQGRLYMDPPSDFRASGTEVRVLDVRGRESFARYYPGGIPAESIPVPGLPEGIYALELKGGALHRTLARELILTHR